MRMTTPRTVPVPFFFFRLMTLLVAGLFFWSLSASADDAPPAALARQSEVPAELEPWIPWVLADLGPAACITIDENHTCDWPASLSLDFEATSATFELNVFADAKTDITLPGDLTLWPLEVKADGKSVAVLDRGGAPSVELARGSHRVTGKFTFERLPETLAIGPHTAFVELELKGKRVEILKRENGQLWLKGLELDQTTSGEPEHVELFVFRKITDGVPLRVETQIVLQVAGRARELELPAPLLPGTVPLAVSGDLAVSLEPSGKLRVQLVPGRHEVTLVARTRGLPEELAMGERAAPWPAQEVWVFEPVVTERVVELSGPPGIDASRTELPSDWKRLGAYSVSATDRLSIKTTRRGEPQRPPNRLTLRREFWLDQDASQFTVRDSLSGEMHQNFRLDLRSGKLGRVELGGEPQVITRYPEDGLRGIEVRDGTLGLVATSRVPHTARLSAVGWSENVDSLEATLHLPPGWDVLAATGVDTMRDTWLGRWDLFAVFYVLVLTLATAKLAGRAVGAVAFVALVLAHGESGAPEYVWLVLVVLAALTKIVHSERWSTALRALFFSVAVVLSISLVAFAVTQIRAALYPHLETSLDVPVGAFDGMIAKEEPAATAAPAPEMAEQNMAAPAAPSQLADKKAVEADQKEGGSGAPRDSASSDSSFARGYGSKAGLSRQKQFQPDAIVQTGPGIPDVVTTTWNLSWSGPVVQDHEMRLFLISPTLERFLTFLRLAALGGFAYLLWTRLPRPRAPSAPRSALGAVPAATALVLAVTFFGTFTSPAAADTPTNERLEELKTRLLKKPSCDPHCLSVSTLSLEATDELVIESEVHAGATAVYKLPGPASAFSSISIQVDGKPTSAVRLGDDGAYYLRVEAGVHRVVLRAEIASDRTTLDLGSTPHRVRVTSRDWVVSGVNDSGRAESGTITLVRSAPRVDDKSSESGTPSKRSELNVPPWFRVERTLSLGVSGSVTTRIVRVSDPTLPEVLLLPLLPGEQVTTPGIEIRQKNAVISFPREIAELEISSTLSLPKEAGAAFDFNLVSPTEASYSEVWKLECGVVWHCRTEGLSAISHLEGNRLLETFSPWPGEKLQILGRAPVPADGQSLTITSATLSLTPGVRLALGRLEFRVETSRSLVHTVKIPANARLERVEVDGQTQAAKNEGGAVRLSLTPGSHSATIAWQSDEGLGLMFRTPAVDLGAAGVNQRTVIELPQERWLLFAGGPAHGPAILFWGHLLLLVVIALLLPRLPYNSLRTYEWLLLGLGLTQIPVFVAFFVVGWFFFVGSRRKWGLSTSWKKDMAQLALVVTTVLFLAALTAAVYEGLVTSPDMNVEGAGSYGNHLAWYVDRSSGPLEKSWVLSTSIWVWRALMLAWALWLARSLLRWLADAWEIAQIGGFWAPRRARLNQYVRAPVAPEGAAPESEPTSTPGAAEATAASDTTTSTTERADESAHVEDGASPNDEGKKDEPS